MTQDDLWRLIGQMTNFYSEHLPMDSSFETLLQVYGKLFEAAYDAMQEVSDSTLLNTTPTVSTLPYSKLDVSTGLYDVLTSQTLKLMAFDDQINFLDRQKLYVEMQFVRRYSRQPVVYGLRLRTNFTDTQDLVLYQDYFLRNNKLYLLPSFIDGLGGATNVLHAFDIKVDSKTLEANWSPLYQVELGPLLPRFEYREVLRGYERAFSGIITIRTIKEAIQTVTRWGTFDLQDYKSPNLPAAKKQLYDSWTLSPAHFIVSLPEGLISDKVRISLLANLLDQVKEPQTSYMMFYDIERDEQPKYLDDEPTPTVRVPKVDTAQLDDSRGGTISLQREEFMFNQEANVYYDANMRYDLNNAYDFQPTAAFDGQTFFETGSLDDTHAPVSDAFSITTLTFPEIPRNFSVTGAGSPNVFTFSCRTNTDGTTDFELYGATSSTGTYALVTSVRNDINASTATLNVDANVTRNTYYKIRAVAPGSASLMTLPLQVTIS